jgi:hypothetical protein
MDHGSSNDNVVAAGGPAANVPPSGTEDGGAAARLAALQRGTDTDGALAFFDGLPGVTVAEMLGGWRGEGLPTGHRLDGLLERFGWRGKRFDSADDGHPLVFDTAAGAIDLHPAFVPMPLVLRYPRWFGTELFAGAFRAVAPLLRTRRPRARLRPVEHRGVVSAAMIYDDLPVCDHFRRVDADTRLGLMDSRGMRRPFFFVLRREAPPP